MGDIKSSVTLLKGENYATWKIQCRMALMKDGLWGMVCGSDEVPENDEALRKYIIKRDRALSIIVLAVDTTLLYLLDDPVDPAVVWKTLEDQYQKKSWANKLRLRRKLYSLKVDEDQPIQKHLKSMSEIFQELSIIGHPVDEEDKVVQMLSSLPKSYEMLVTALEANSEIPRMESITEKIIHEERKLKAKEKVSKEEKVLAAENYSRSHSQENNSEARKCFYCKKPGHIKRFCNKLKQDEDARNKKEKANIVQLGKTTQRKYRSNHHDDSSSDSESSGFVATNHALSSKSKGKKSEWIVDSGATNDMCNDKKWFKGKLNKLEVPESIKVGDGAYVEALYEGTIELEIKISENVTQVYTMHNVLYAPDLAYNLLSVSKASKYDNTIEFKGNLCKITSNVNNKLLAVAKKVSELWLVDCKKNLSDEAVYTTAVEPTKPTKNKIWHSRYGHLGANNLRKLVDGNLVEGLDYKKCEDNEFCKACVEGKHHKQKFPKVGGTRAEEILDLVHTDVCGKMDTESLSRKEYFISFIDDKSRHAWTYAIRRKSDSFSVFLEWKSKVERSRDKKLKTLRSDNGGEYISEEFESYLRKDGIAHQRTIRKTPEQNGVAERMNRTLVEVVRSMLSESSLPKKFWAEALATATYLRNRSPTKAVEGMTPIEAWSGEKPNVTHLRVFGSTCYSHIPKDERKKLDSKAQEAIFLGYGLETKGYRLYNINSQKVYFSRDVIFNEMKFPRNKQDRIEGQEINSKVELEIKEVEEASDSETANEEEPKSSRKSARQRRAPDHYGEWVNIANENNAEPRNVKEALNGEHKTEWKEAMQNEIDSLKKHQVWDLVELPPGRKAIGSKWIFKLKTDADGKIERYKARLVAQGFNQRYGIDYEETFSPVVRFESVRTVLALAAKLGFKLHQMDIKTAFLNGELEEEIFMRQPEAFIEEGNENLVCKLKRSIYGLKQSARCWNTELDQKLRSIGFTQSKNDPCIYTRITGGELFVIAVYVDDIIEAGKNEAEIEEVKKSISKKFDAVDMGPLHYFLGVKVIQNDQGVWIGQPSYIRTLLSKFRMDDCNPVETPADVSLKLKKAEENEALSDKELYQSAVGSILYVSTRTRPDISYAIGSCARFSANPTKCHWTAVKRIMRYLKGTINAGVMYSSQDQNSLLVGYSDADWAGDVDDRKSTSGYVFQISGGAVCWRSKKQSCVALSTAEAEYMALASATQEAVWMKQLISDIHADVLKNPVRIHEDNQSTICIAKNHQYHGRSKHIDIKFHFTRDQVSSGNIEVTYCKSEEMVADLLTKPLSAPQFKLLRGLLGMVTTIEEE